MSMTCSLEVLTEILRRGEYRRKQHSDPNCKLSNFTEKTLHRLLFECRVFTAGVHYLNALAQNINFAPDINLIANATLLASIGKLF